MVRESGSPAWGVEAGDHRKWFDGWRIVTGVLTVPFLAGSVGSFSEVDDEKRRVAECEAEGGYDCGDWDLSDGFTVVGLYLLAVAGCFGAATVAALGSGWRRGFTGIGVTLVYLPALVVALAVAAHQGGPDLAWALFYSNVAIAFVALLFVLRGQVIGLIRRVMP